MKRQIPGVSQPLGNGQELPEGLYRVRVERVRYCYQAQKPYYTLYFAVLEPETAKGQNFSGRLYCTERALWKLSWFLRDFGYDAELLDREELDDRALVGLTGVVKVSHTVLNGRFYLNLEGFAPSNQWVELSVSVGGEG